MPKVKIGRGWGLENVARSLGLPATNLARVRDAIRRAGGDPNNLRAGQSFNLNIDLSRIGGGRATTALAQKAAAGIQGYEAFAGYSPTGTREGFVGGGATGVSRGLQGPDIQATQSLAQPTAQLQPTQQTYNVQAAQSLRPPAAEAPGGARAAPGEVFTPTTFRNPNVQATGSLRGVEKSQGLFQGFGGTQAGLVGAAGAAPQTQQNAALQSASPVNVQAAQSLSGAVAQDTRRNSFGQLTQVAGAPLQDPSAVQATLDFNARDIMAGNPQPLVPAATAQYLQTLDPEIYGALLSGGYKLYPGGELRYDPDFAQPGGVASPASYGGYTSSYSSRGRTVGRRGGRGSRGQFSQAMNGLINWRIGFG